MEDRNPTAESKNRPEGQKTEWILVKFRGDGVDDRCCAVAGALLTTKERWDRLRWDSLKSKPPSDHGKERMWGPLDFVIGNLHFRFKDFDDFLRLFEETVVDLAFAVKFHSIFSKKMSWLMGPNLAWSETRSVTIVGDLPVNMSGYCEQGVYLEWYRGLFPIADPRVDPDYAELVWGAGPPPDSTRGSYSNLDQNSGEDQ